MKEKLIEFLRKKDYKLIQSIGQGGTGKTVLIEDEFINEKFICKKYSPIYKEHQDIYFNNFIDEIKLLHLLYHKNVVRVFNYYLYPEKTTGYILMEFINGTNISNFIKANPDKLNDIFTQTISGFRHLEENNILHRDIRPENLMVSDSGILKIIDFGFGKKVDFETDVNNSVSLNWRYTIPKDFEFKIYDFRTEIYFVGKLFEEIIKENNIQNFSYSSVILSMIKFDYEQRINSFFDADRKIIEETVVSIDFSSEERETYQVFANRIVPIINKIERNAEYIKDTDKIIDALENCYRNSILEEYVQNPVSIVRCFLRGDYYYDRSLGNISVNDLKNFLQLLKSVSVDKKRIIINNLWQRLDKIIRYSNPLDDDLPF